MYPELFGPWELFAEEYDMRHGKALRLLGGVTETSLLRCLWSAHWAEGGGWLGDLTRCIGEHISHTQRENYGIKPRFCILWKQTLH